MKKALRYVLQWIQLILILVPLLPIMLAAWFCFYMDETDRRRKEKR